MMSSSFLTIFMLSWIAFQSLYILIKYVIIMLSHLEYAYAYDKYNKNYDQSLRFLLLECEMLTVMPQSTIHLTRWCCSIWFDLAK